MCKVPVKMVHLEQIQWIMAHLRPLCRHPKSERKDFSVLSSIRFHLRWMFACWGLARLFGGPLRLQSVHVKRVLARWSLEVLLY
jgi:hypothetical protein